MTALLHYLQYAPEQYLLFFFLYSAMGWVGEVAFAALTEHQLVNRGFLNGPLCPLYGSGMVLLLLLLGPWMHNPFVVFFGGMLITTGVELLTGLIMFHLFQMRWWDYSMYKYNLGGYICLRFTLYWGVGSVVLVMMVQPIVAAFTAAIPPRAVVGINGWLLVLFAADVGVSVAAAFGLNQRLAQLDEARTALRRGSDMLTNLVGGNVMSADEMLDEQKVRLALAMMEGRDNAAEMQQQFLEFRGEVSKKYHNALSALDHQRFFGAGRLLRAFPDMKSKNYREVIAKWRDHAVSLAGKAKSGLGKKLH
ncbi:MAG: hypothetical protein PHO10_00660 [Gemmiger sp.]|nr:hypothetical protein [Gemmiger sp.]